jgi:DNA-binding CsgD family transcriptional regulator
MNLHLTSTDLARCEAVSRALLSPLAAGSVDQWRAEVLRTLRELLHADQTLFMLSTAERVHYSDSLDAQVVQGYDRYLAGADGSGVHLTDPVVERWLQVRHAAGQNIFSNAEVDQLLKPYGLTLGRSPMYQEGMASAGVVDQRSMFVTFPGGASMIQCGLSRKDDAPFGEAALALLRMLLPSYRGGLEAMGRFAGQWAAMDTVSQAAAVFGEGPRELHRNPALTRLMDAEPERERLATGIAGIVAALYPMVIGRASTRAEDALPGSMRTVTTAGARYDLRGTVLGAGAFADHPTLMVFVERKGAPALPPPEALRERYRLTTREAEVALLLAEGHSNAEIAERLFLSIHTVRRHAENVREKVGVNSRKALGLRFLEN